jgi:hypothetical protein
MGPHGQCQTRSCAHRGFVARRRSTGRHRRATPAQNGQSARTSSRKNRVLNHRRHRNHSHRRPIQPPHSPHPHRLENHLAETLAVQRRFVVLSAAAGPGRNLVMVAVGDCRGQSGDAATVRGGCGRCRAQEIEGSARSTCVSAHLSRTCSRYPTTNTHVSQSTFSQKEDRCIFSSSARRLWYGNQEWKRGHGGEVVEETGGGCRTRSGRRDPSPSGRPTTTASAPDDSSRCRLRSLPASSQLACRPLSAAAESCRLAACGHRAGP